MTQPPFQTAVKTNIPDAQRREAIDTLASNEQTTGLKVLVRISGLSGGLRRQAVDGPISCGAHDLFDELAADRSIAPARRKKADR